MLLGVGAVATKTYVDDIFSTFLYKGTGSAQSINNGIDLSSEGGMVWIKSRDWTRSHNIYDTVRGTNKVIYTESSNTEVTKGPSNADSGIYQFNNNGFNIGAINGVGANNYNYSSWTFRKAPGFFDVVQYTGTGSAQHISHSLSCIPGLIMVKCTSANHDWAVYHRSTKSTHFLELNETNVAADNISRWNDTDPTSTNFTVGTSGSVNDNNSTYIAYVFAGGASTASGAVSVAFDGSNDKVSIPDSTDFEFGSGDFTVEAWVKQSNSAGAGADSHTIVNKWHNTSDAKEWILRIDNGTGSNKLQWLQTTNGNSNQITTGNTVIHVGQWYHVAVVGHSGTIKLFVNGIQQASTATQGTIHSYSNPLIFGYNQSTGGQWMDGLISNCRIVKGTAVYTSSFKPPTEPLTNITNTKLLCLNNSSVTGSTVSPGTLTNDGATASTDSPDFDDPAGFVFGENEDQNIIKCGSYVGTGSGGFEVHVGFEPSWIIVKSATSAENWEMYDSMRGLAVGGNAERLKANTTDSEDTNSNWFSLTANGFIVNSTSGTANTNGETYIYMAIRRSDGYVGKPPSLGTDVFAMDTGAGDTSTTIPNYDSGFPVDFALSKQPAITSDWYATARLTGTKEVSPNKDTAEDSSVNYVWDSNLGWGNGAWQDSGNQSWMWKRHAGFEFQAYNGVSGTSSRPHSMNAVPEMIWAKRTIYSEDWVVYHKGLNGGTNPHQYYLKLNTTDAEVNGNQWNAQPTSTHWFTAAGGLNNNADQPYIAMLFASVDGISKLGHYFGSSSDFSIDLGFTPRLWISRRVNQNGSGWIVFDTLRGMSSSVDDPYMYLNSTAASNAYSSNSIDISGNTITLKAGVNNDTLSSSSSDNFIYYAHA